MTDAERLSSHIDIWWEAINDFADLLDHVPDEQWSTPTDLPGWDVRTVAAHIAHLEAILAGASEETADLGAQPGHVTSLTGLYTEQGVVARGDRTPDQIREEIRTTATARHTALLADPPTDAAAKPEVVPAGVSWTWEVLLRNRPLDVWMHEQDVRRAVDRPGGMDSRAARHTAEYLAEGLGYVLAKRVGAPAGTSLVLEIAGSAPFAFMVDDKGRGRQVADVPDAPTVRLRMDRETFVVLAGGRCAATPGAVEIEGDDALGRQVIEGMAMTP